MNQLVATSPHLALGRFGEQAAVTYLKTKAYRIVATNFTAPIGYSFLGRLITGEIDIIAYDESVADPVLVFIEVKTRSSTRFAAPEAAVDLRKQRQIIRAARVYRRMVDLINEPYRYDVITVIMEAGRPQVAMLRDYFSEASFARSQWHGREF